MRRDRFTTYAWSVLGYNLLVILWGAWVRITGSGAGCGSDWPECNGEILPRDPEIETLIELTHRATSGLVLPLVIVMLVWAFRLYSKGHPVRAAAVWVVILTLVEAAIGAGLVLFEMVDENDSLQRAAWIGGHLGNTLLLLTALTLTAHWGSPRYRPPDGAAPSLRWADQGRMLWLISGSVVGTMIVGITGAVTALGDTLIAASVEAGRALSPTVSLLKELRVIHPLIAIGVSLLLLQLVNEVRRRRLGGLITAPGIKGWANRLHLLVFTQLGIGAVNVALAAPGWIQIVHLLFADLLWIYLIIVCVTSLERPGAANAAAD